MYFEVDRITQSNCRISVYNMRITNYSKTVRAVLDGNSSYSNSMTVAPDEDYCRFYLGVPAHSLINIQLTVNYDTEDGSNQTDRINNIYTRPNDFEWDASKTSNGNFNVTANEWNKLQQNIEQLYEAQTKGEDYTGLGRVSKGDDFTADAYNKIVYALQAAGSSYSTTVSQGQTVTATLINNLRTYANRIELDTLYSS